MLNRATLQSRSFSHFIYKVIICIQNGKTMRENSFRHHRFYLRHLFNVY